MGQLSITESSIITQISFPLPLLKILRNCSTFSIFRIFCVLYAWRRLLPTAKFKTFKLSWVASEQSHLENWTPELGRKENIARAQHKVKEPLEFHEIFIYEHYVELIRQRGRFAVCIYFVVIFLNIVKSALKFMNRRNTKFSHLAS